jgi:hypothetical protein
VHCGQAAHPASGVGLTPRGQGHKSQLSLRPMGGVGLDPLIRDTPIIEVPVAPAWRASDNSIDMRNQNEGGCIRHRV